MRSLLFYLLLASARLSLADVEATTTDTIEEYRPAPVGDYVFFESFQDDPFTRWTKSKNAKYGSQKWLTEPASEASIPGDKALIVGEKAKHYGVFARFDQPLDNTDKNFVVQYEVALTKGLECGGAYLKFIDAEATKNAKMELTNETPYIVMFGPDKCGATNKVHLIIRHKNPISGVWEEKHLKHAPSVPSDEMTHLYTLTIRNDNTFDVKIDQEVKREGSLKDEFDPPFTPSKEIDDPEDKKPADWVDEKMITDTSATKPEDWDEDAPFEIVDTEATKPEGWMDDESEYIADPDAVMPDDWDVEEDGDWEAPLIKNPKCEVGCGTWERPRKRNPEYKGKWSAPLIENPDYKGEWAPRKIENPYYFVEETPSNLPKIGGVAIEIWTMTDGIAFDNIFAGYDAAVASKLADSTWKVKHDRETSASEKKKAEVEQKRRESLKADGSFTSKLEYYSYEVIDFFKSHPVALIPPVLLLVGLLYFLVSKAMSADTVKYDDEGDVDETTAPTEEETTTTTTTTEEEKPVVEKETVVRKEHDSPLEKDIIAEKLLDSDVAAEGIRKRKNVPKTE